MPLISLRKSREFLSVLSRYLKSRNLVNDFNKFLILLTVSENVPCLCDYRLIELQLK